MTTRRVRPGESNQAREIDMVAPGKRRQHPQLQALGSAAAEELTRLLVEARKDAKPTLYSKRARNFPPGS